MKIRTGFVSNSSSSSFIILYKGNKEQLEEKLKTVVEVPEDHALYSILKDASKVVIKSIEEEFTTPEEIQKSNSFFDEEKQETIARLEGGFHIFTGAFADDYEGSLASLLCNNGLNYKSADLIIECDGGY